MIITIPENFSVQINNNGKTELQYQLNNNFSDVTKNGRLRINNTVNNFNYKVLGIKVPIVEYNGLLSNDIPRSWFLCVGAIVYALIFGGILNTGYAISREWEDLMIKEILLSQASRVSIIGGKMLSGAVMTLANATANS